MKGLGDRIKYYRKKKGLTRKQLSENLCDESTIFRIEKTCMSRGWILYMHLSKGWIFK